MRVKETFDRWDTDHPFHNNRHPVSLLAITNLENDQIGSERLALTRSNKERRQLAYILWCLREGQEYDAGNAILCASQSGGLSDDSIALLAKIFVSKEVVFLSKIGQILLIKIGRSFGVHLCDIGRLDLGLSLFYIAIETSLRMNYGEKEAMSEWQHFKEVVQPLPECIADAMKKLPL